MPRTAAPVCSKFPRSSDVSVPETFATARAVRDAIAARECSAEEVCRAALDRIAAVDAGLHAFHLVDADRALDRARALDRQTAPLGPLHGVPIAIKDNIVVRDMTTTAGSRILEGFRPPYDATVVER